MTSIKDKIAAVRRVVSTYSNDEIVLVLQHHDEDVEKTIADFVEGRATHILTEWKHAGQSKTKAKKRKKKMQQKKARLAQATTEHAVDHKQVDSAMLMNGGAETAVSDNNHGGIAVDESQAAVTLKQMLTNSQPKSGPVLENDAGTSLERQSTPPVDNVNGVTTAIASEDTPAVPKSSKPHHHHNHHYLHHGRRSRTSSESSTKSTSKKKHIHQPSTLVTSGNHANASGQLNQQAATNSATVSLANRKSIEKAVRDLQRCAVSFGRYKTLLNDEINDSYKRIKQVFEEISSVIMDREVTLIRKLDEMKEEAFEFIAKREAQAHELKRQTDRADSMSHQQLNELRNDIKHFVADRKYDEELSRTTRFIYDRELVAKILPSFGDITGVKNSHAANRRARTESTASDAPSESSSVASHPVSKPPSQLPIAHPHQPASAPSGDKANTGAGPQQDGAGKQHERASNDSGAPVSNGHVEDWAAESSDLPIPESPASWANDTPIMTPDSGKWSNEQKNADSQPQRQPRRNRQNEGSVPQKDKDKELMPPPATLPPPRTPLSNKQQSETKDEPIRDSQAHRGDRGARRNFGGRNRGGYYRGGGDGYRNQSRDHWQPRGGYRGYRGGGRGSYRGQRGSGPGRQTGSPAYSKQPVPEEWQQKSADPQSKPPDRPPSQQKDKEYSKPAGGRHYGQKTAGDAPSRSPKQAEVSKTPSAAANAKGDTPPVS